MPILDPRNLAKEMLKRIPKKLVRDEGAFIPGGDLRFKNNLWVRAAFRASGLKRVPRETRLRGVVQRVMKKSKIGALACKVVFSSKLQFVRVVWQ